MKTIKKVTQKAKKEPPDIKKEVYGESNQVQIESESDADAVNHKERIIMKEKLREMEAKLQIK